MKDENLKQKMLNRRLRDLLKRNGITNLNLTSVGNSIASGYSMNSTIKPLLFRNESLKGIMDDGNICLSVCHFARAQNNCDEHINEWFVGNKSLSEIFEMNRRDYDGLQISMPSSLTKKEIEQYYPSDIENDEGLKDRILRTNPGLANIVIYSGITGSFLDNWTRGGKHLFTFGLNRDIKGLEATLKEIQYNNRQNNINTQVYIGGAPNFLGLRVSELFNYKLRKIPQEYANVTFVEPAKAKFIYPQPNGKVVVDIHYDEEEYVKFNNNITEAIIDNYLLNQVMIEIDRELVKLNYEIEIEQTISLDDNDTIITRINEIVNRCCLCLLGNDEQIKKYNKRIKKYILENLPYDFHYISRKNLKDSNLFNINKVKVLKK